MYRQHKILLARFSTLCADAGDLLASRIKTLFHKAVLSDEASVPDGRYSLMVGDKFPFFRDMGGSSFNDGAVFGLTSDLRRITIVAPQTRSSLLRKGGSERPLKAFLGDRVTKIFLQQSAPLPWSGSAPSAVTPTPFSACPAAPASTSPPPDGRFVRGSGTVNDAYDHVRELLAGTETSASGWPARLSCPPRPRTPRAGPRASAAAPPAPRRPRPPRGQARIRI